MAVLPPTSYFFPSLLYLNLNDLHINLTCFDRAVPIQHRMLHPSIPIILFFLNFILIYKLNIQIQISLVIGNLYSADLITGISSMKKLLNK